MPKKVLIVESSLAVRGIAESLLRQNGYEVFAADTVAAANDILRGSKVDLLLVASDINDDTGRPFFEALGAESSTAMLPLLVLHDSAGGGDLAYPPEAIINKPFTPRDFLESVAIFGGGLTAQAEPAPLSDSDLEDAIIDSALGLDKIEVDDTEVLDDDSAVYRKLQGKDKVESMIGYDFKVKAEDSAKLPRKDITSINLPPETSAPKPPAKPQPPTPEKHEFLGKADDSKPKRPPETLSESSKIEIITDQYGITAPPESLDVGPAVEADTGHDYDWFLKELRKENTEEGAPRPPVGKKPETVPPSKTASKPTPPPAAATHPAPQEKAPTHTEAVDKFISEFKKEMEKITGEGHGNIEVTNIAPSETVPDTPKPRNASADAELDWEEGLERVTPAELRGLSKHMIEIIAREIADKIVARLDEDIIYHLIKESVETVIQRRTTEKSRKP